MCLALWSPMDCSQTGSSVNGDSPGKKTGVGCLASSRESSQLRDRIQVSCIAGRFLYWLSHQGSPRTLEWVAYPFTRGSSWSRNLNWGLLHWRWILYQLSYQGRRSDCSHDINCHNSEDWPQEMETNWPWNWRLTACKTIKVPLVRPPMTNFKTVRADCAVSACSPLPLAHWLSVGRVNLWTGPAFLYPAASIHSKASFPFHQPCVFISFWVVSSQTPLLVTQGVLERKWPTPAKEPVSCGEPDLQCIKKVKRIFREVRYRGYVVRAPWKGFKSWGGMRYRVRKGIMRPCGDQSPKDERSLGDQGWHKWRGRQGGLVQDPRPDSSWHSCGWWEPVGEGWPGASTQSSCPLQIYNLLEETHIKWQNSAPQVNFGIQKLWKPIGRSPNSNKESQGKLRGEGEGGKERIGIELHQIILTLPENNWGASPTAMNLCTTHDLSQKAT